jgi:hypothetical protein
MWRSRPPNDPATVNCYRHNVNDAVAICAFCGRGMCLECLPAPAPARAACSAECAQHLARESEAIRTLVERSVQSARASAFYCYLSGALSAGAAVAAWFMLPSPFLVSFTAGCAVVLVAAGFWHGRVGRQFRRN